MWRQISRDHHCATIIMIRRGLTHLGKIILGEEGFVRNLAQSKMSLNNKPIENSMKIKLQSALSPTHLDIINESHMHNVPKGSETHFKVVCVSEKFENMPLIQRHRLVNSTLDYELKNGVHALSIVAKTPSQWTDDNKVEPSPKCLGGFGQ